MRTPGLLFACFVLLPLSLHVGYAGTATASPESPSSCKATRWPYARNQSKRDIVKTLRMITDRGVIEQYLFKELSEPQSGPLAYSLLTYLTFTEQDENMEGFYELLNWGSELKDESSTPRQLSLKEICDYYQKAKTLTRDPASAVTKKLPQKRKQQRSERRSAYEKEKTI